MDWGSIVAPIVSFVLGIGVVGAFVAKYAGAAKKYLNIATEALSLLNTVVKAIEDKEVTAGEVNLIKDEINDLMAALK